MNKLFMYLVGTGVLILVLIVGWEVLQISSGLRSTVNQTVIPMPRSTIFPENVKTFLENKKIENSGIDPTYVDATGIEPTNLQ